MSDKTPPPTAWPTLRATDARALIRFLVDVVGFEETAVYGEGDVVHHAELSWPLGGGTCSARRATTAPTARPPRGMQRLHRRRRAGRVMRAHARRGAEVTIELHDTDYGSRDSGSATPRATAGTSAPTAAHPARPEPAHTESNRRTRCSSGAAADRRCAVARTGCDSARRKADASVNGARRRGRSTAPGWRGRSTRDAFWRRHTPGVTAAPFAQVRRSDGMCDGANGCDSARRRARAERRGGMNKVRRRGPARRPTGSRLPRTVGQLARDDPPAGDDLRDEADPVAVLARAHGVPPAVRRRRPARRGGYPCSPPPAPARARSSRCGCVVDVVDLEATRLWSAAAVIFGESVRMTTESPSSE